MTRKISFAIPAYEEAPNISMLLGKLVNVLKGEKYLYEIIIVDDGSQDSTWQTILEEAKKNPNVIGLRLARNFGHQSALIAALSHASGDAVISLDADLQHPPEAVPSLLRAWEEGYPVVQTQRVDNSGTGLFKKITSKYFYKLFSYFANVKLTKGSSDFRLLDRSALQALLEMENAFLRGSVEWLGYNSKTIKFDVGKRYKGHSKYTLKRMLQFAYKAMISHSTKPLRLGIWVGTFTSLFAFIQLVYVFYQYWFGYVVPGWASTIGIMSFLFGILFVMIGIIGVYLAEIHEKLLNRPNFIVAEETTTFYEKNNKNKP